MNGKFIAGFLVCAGAVAGAVLWYTSYVAFYEELPSQDAVSIGDQAYGVVGFQGIDAESSPLKLRACFRFQDAIPQGQGQGQGGVDDPTPLVAPGWFSCFDAEAIADDLKDGVARAVLAQANAPFGFDQVLAVYEDGRGFLWRQMNLCGTRHFDGKRLPEGCPPPPDHSARKE